MWTPHLPTTMINPETLPYAYGNYTDTHTLPTLNHHQRSPNTTPTDSSILDIGLVAFCLFMITFLTVLGIWLHKPVKERVVDIEKAGGNGDGEGDGRVGVYRDQRGGMELDFDWERMSIEWERKYLKDGGSVIGMGVEGEFDGDGEERGYGSLGV